MKHSHSSQLNGLLKQQKQLKTQITQNLGILIGSVVKSPSMGGYCLTDKIKGKTVTRYVRQSIVPLAMEMTRTCQRLWKLIRQLFSINWQILKEKAGKD